MQLIINVIYAFINNANILSVVTIATDMYLNTLTKCSLSKDQMINYMDHGLIDMKSSVYLPYTTISMLTFMKLFNLNGLVLYK